MAVDLAALEVHIHSYLAPQCVLRRLELVEVADCLPALLQFFSTPALQQLYRTNSLETVIEVNCVHTYLRKNTTWLICPLFEKRPAPSLHDDRHRAVEAYHLNVLGMVNVGWYDGHGVFERGNEKLFEVSLLGGTGQGRGRALLAKALLEAERLGAKGVCLELLGGRLNSAAFRLYAAFGFVEERVFSADQHGNATRQVVVDQFGTKLCYMTRRRTDEQPLISHTFLNHHLDLSRAAASDATSFDLGLLEAQIRAVSDAQPAAPTRPLARRDRTTYAERPCSDDDDCLYDDESSDDDESGTLDSSDEELVLAPPSPSTTRRSPRRSQRLHRATTHAK